MNLKKDRQHNLTLPLLPFVILIGEELCEMLVIVEREVMEIQLELLKLIERNTRFEFTFGEETFLADSNELC